MAAVKSLSRLAQLLLSNEESLAKNLPPNLLSEIIASILKQGVERLDNVREVVGLELRAIISCLDSTAPKRYVEEIPGLLVLRPMVNG